jgi:alpha-D-xyloside xylohydrolase
VYLPRAAWHDFWTQKRVEGGREISRPVELETIPLYVREGSILPFGPVKQFTREIVDEPLSVFVVKARSETGHPPYLRDTASAGRAKCLDRSRSPS